MKDRPFLKELIRWCIAVGILFIGLRYGIVIPPPNLPPSGPPITEPPAPVEPKPDIAAAIGRIQFGNAGCTATPVGKRRPDGRYWVLTAAHCVRAVGDRGRFTSQRGDRLTVTVAGIDKRADCAWLLTDSTNLELPFGELATDVPPVGTQIWHKGYGVHIPGNLERGVIVAGPNSDGQLQFHLSVSSGDSGGAICVDSDGRIVSCVCCTTGRGQMADVWGAGPQAIRRLQTSATDDPDWTPMSIPIREPIPQKLPK